MSELDKKLDEVYFYWMDKAMKAQRKAKNIFFKELGLNLTTDQWMILKKLSEVERGNQRDLARSINKDPASLTRILDILEKAGYVLRRKHDRRSFVIELTAQGKSTVERVLPKAIAFRKKGIAGIKNQEMEIFQKVLVTIEKNFSDDL